MRSALTALGVIIGVGAVIAMTEIGEGSKAAVQKSIASMGANNRRRPARRGDERRSQFRRGKPAHAHAGRRRAVGPAVPGDQRLRPHRADHGPVGLRPNQLEDPVRRRHHAQLPQRPRLDRDGGGRSLFRPRRAECQQGLHGRHHDQARGFRQRVARGQGPADCQRRFSGHRRLVFQGREHDGPRPGRHRRGPLDDGQVPSQRRVGQRRGECQPHGEPGPGLRDQQPQQPLSELHGPVCFDHRRSSRPTPRNPTAW